MGGRKLSDVGVRMDCWGQNRLSWLSPPARVVMELFIASS
jgi:hypothetical protein